MIIRIFNGFEDWQEKEELICQFVSEDDGAESFSCLTEKLKGRKKILAQKTRERARRQNRLPLLVGSEYPTQEDEKEADEEIEAYLNNK